tara:strand:- start:197 stop:472 length:276 start_codon:yes stop_codon:yes gene_type:complete
MVKKEKFVKCVKESKMGNIKDAIEDMNNLVKDIDRDEYSEIQELQSRIDWLEKGLKKISNHYSYTDVPLYVRNIARSYLDGEPTTADEFNE